jgi:hypothetical protein
LKRTHHSKKLPREIYFIGKGSGPSPMKMPSSNHWPVE